MHPQSTAQPDGTWSASIADTPGVLYGGPTTTQPCYPHFAPGDARQLLAEISRWRKANGWTPSDQRGWVNALYSGAATVAVDYDDEKPIGFTVNRKDPRHGSWLMFPPLYEAGSVRQAVDMLVALDILPAKLSSAYRAGLNDGYVDGRDAALRAFDAHFNELKLASQDGVA